MGAYHTLDVEQNRKFILKKPKWDSIALERVDTACDPTQVYSSKQIVNNYKTTRIIDSYWDTLFQMQIS